MKEKFSEIELKKLDINNLLTFTALMREQSVTRAAARLMVGPPAVSMALSKLRLTFNDPLFVRSGRKMIATPRAEAIFAKMEAALETLGDILRDPIDFEPATAQRTIRFASPDDLEMVLIPKLLKRIGVEAPGIQLIVCSADFRNVPLLLENDEVDLALTATPPKLEKNHRHETIYTERFSAVFDPEVTRLPGQLTIKSYTETPHILLSTRGDTRGPIDETLATYKKTRRIVASVPRFSTVPFILKSRPSIINMPSVAADHFAASFDLKAIELPFESPSFDVSMLWQLRADKDPMVRWFKDLVRSCVNEILKANKSRS